MQRYVQGANWAAQWELMGRLPCAGLACGCGGGGGSDPNMRAIFLHIVADTLGSVAVILSTLAGACPAAAAAGPPVLPACCACASPPYIGSCTL